MNSQLMGLRAFFLAATMMLLNSTHLRATVILSAGWQAYNAEPHNPWIGSSKGVEYLDRLSPYSWELFTPQFTWTKGNAAVKRITLQAHSSASPIGAFSRNFSSAEAVFRDQVQFVSDRPDLETAGGTFRATIYSEGAVMTNQDPLAPANIPTIATWQASAALGQRFAEASGSATGDGTITGTPITGAYVLDVPFMFNGDEETFSFHASAFARSTIASGASAQSLANVDLNVVWGGAEVLGPDGSILVPGRDYEARFAGYANDIGDGSYTWLTPLPEPITGCAVLAPLAIPAFLRRYRTNSSVAV